MEKLVLFGGTFDPVHNGHLRIARFASLKLNADVVFVPAKAPRWKTPHASIKDRANMLRMALKKEGTGSVYISDYEIKKDEPVNYTIDTIRYFKDKFKNREICLLIGADQVASFHNWKEADRIAALATIIYVDRPGIEINSENIKKYNMQSLYYEGSGSVSSESIRNLINLDTPKEVLDYIVENDLYYIAKIKPYYKEKRYAHILSVADLSYKIARANHIENYEKAYIAGLLHDIAKSMPLKDQKDIMMKHYNEYLENLAPSVYHQFVSEYIAIHDLNIKDEVVLDAIKFHTTGKANMPPISKIVYSADKLDPLRGVNNKKLIKACMNDYYNGFQMVLQANKKYLTDNKFDINNPLTESCFDLYLSNKEEK